MNNLIAFFNMFLSYLLLVVIIVALCAVAGFIGISLRKRKNRIEEETATDSKEE